MNNNIAILLIILVIAGISIGLYYNKSSSSAPLITTVPPRMTTTPPLITTAPPIITKAPPIITTAPPRITTASPLITTAPPRITTAPPIITTASPLITTAPPRITTAPPIITTAPPIITTAPPIILPNGTWYSDNPNATFYINTLDNNIIFINNRYQTKIKGILEYDNNNNLIVRSTLTDNGFVTINSFNNTTLTLSVTGFTLVFTKIF